MTGREITRRGLLTSAFAAGASGAAGSAEGLPSGPIRLVVPRAPGGGSDNLARVIAQPLAARLSRPVVVDNRPDATAILGAEIVARAPPDGGTLYLSDNSFYQNPSFIPRLPYDTIRDFTAVTMLAESPLLLIVPAALPVRDLPGLVAHVRANRGRVNFASGGVGSSGHFAGVLFNLRAGTDMTHVPFRSAAPALTALLSGEVSLQFGGISSARPLVEDGRVRAIAVTGRARDPAMPEVLTLAEAGLEGLENIVSTFGLHAPARTPLAVRAALRDAVTEVAREPALERRLRDLGYAPVLNTPDEHQAQTERLIALWVEVGRRVNLNE